MQAIIIGESLISMRNHVCTHHSLPETSPKMASYIYILAYIMSGDM